MLSSTANLLRRTVTKQIGRRSFAVAAAAPGQQLSDLAEKWPHADAIRYEWKNTKWTFREVDFFAESLSSGLLETGFVPGDAILSWLPSNVAEQHVLQFACAKAGFVLYTLDPSQAKDDLGAARDSLEQALTDTDAVALFTLQAGDDVNYLNICQSVIPETKLFDFQCGEQFFSPKFPNLRLPVSCGFDRLEGRDGFVLYKHLMMPNGATSDLLNDTGISITEKTPLFGQLVSGPNGLPVKGKVLSSEDVMNEKVWPEFSSILAKEYIEVPGTGVVL